ncbi:tetratricopeptide repeat protein [Nafulsella turpanensis]|uniref:tetratricopeptide repeat protein n=1 Tax=Nafulsella turpanensis TaxID=1265690 RepID=UPI00135F141D|nr:tetratricopeptide repeat protein [Nafulsella turpanensis]
MSFSYGQKKKNKKQESSGQTLSTAERARAESLFTDGIKSAILEDYPKAISYLQHSLEIDPSNSAAYFKLAELLFDTGNLPEAEKSISRAIQLSDSNQYYYQLAADIQAQQGKYEKAALYYEDMLKKTNASPQHILELAVLYLHLNNYDKALQTFERAEKFLGVNEQIILQKQKIHLQQNQLADALREGERLINNFPGEPAYVIYQAELLLNNQRQQEAIRFLEDYLSKQPGQPQASYLLGKAYLQQNDFAAAEKYLQAAFQSPDLKLELKVQEIAQLLQQVNEPEITALLEPLTTALLEAHPHQSQAYVVRGDYLFALQQKQAARAAYLQALALDQNNFQAWQNALSLGLELGRFDSVAREAEEALVMFPNQPAFYYFSGAANLSKKEFQKAIFALEQGKEMAYNNPELQSVFYSHLGDAYNGAKDFKKSDEAYQAALEIDPNNDYILNNYSYYLSLRKEKLGLARKLSEQLIQQNPDNPNYLDTHAWVLYQLKQYKEARKHLEKAIQKGGDQNSTILEHYGDVLYQLNEKAQALEQWKKARALPGASEKLDKKIKDQSLYE